MSPKRSAPFKFSNKDSVCISHLSHLCHMPHSSIFLDLITVIIALYKFIIRNVILECPKFILRIIITKNINFPKSPTHIHNLMHSIVFIVYFQPVPDNSIHGSEKNTQNKTNQLQYVRNVYHYN
jgi:hypothetical protein